MPVRDADVVRLADLFTIEDWQDQLPWTFFCEGVEIYRLYGDGVSGPTASLLRFSPGASVPFHEHRGYEHIIVLAGAQVDENSRADAGSLIVNPPLTRHTVFSEHGCIVLAIYERPVVFVANPEQGEPPA